MCVVTTVRTHITEFGIVPVIEYRREKEIRLIKEWFLNQVKFCVCFAGVDCPPSDLQVVAETLADVDPRSGVRKEVQSYNIGVKLFDIETGAFPQRTHNIRARLLEGEIQCFLGIRKAGLGHGAVKLRQVDRYMIVIFALVLRVIYGQINKI